MGSNSSSQARRRALCDGWRPCQGTVVIRNHGSLLSNFQDYRHNQRPPRRVLHDEALQVLANFFLDHAVVALLFVAGRLKGVHHRLPRLIEETILAGVGGEAAHHDFGWSFHLTRQLVDGDDGQHDAVFAEVTAIANDQILHHIAHGIGIDADAAYGNASRLARPHLVEFENVAALDHHDFSHRVVHGAGHFGVQLELAILAVDGNKVLRLYQVDDELQLFLAGVPADVHRRRRTIIVDDVSVAAE